MPPPQIQYPTVGSTHIIPYIPAGFQPPPCQRNPDLLNIVKVHANQNICFLCRFNAEDWDTSARWNSKKVGHQDGFTCSNYMEYTRANHPFCRKAMYNNVSQQLLTVWGNECRC